MIRQSIISSLLAVGTLATPSPERWFVSQTVATPYGTLSVHSLNTTVETRGIDPHISPYSSYASCSAWELECSPKSAPFVTTCDALFRAFASAEDLYLAKKPRALCLDGPGIGQCCVSWSKPLGKGMQPKYLLEPAEKIRYGCVERQNMAGAVRNVDYGVCVTVCLSSKPKECKDRKEDKKKKGSGNNGGRKWWEG
ncbi:hypothetical protein B0T16DRAFT_407622 [Cercophora newfieldiana]|uniref:WD-like domain-containing protein n=1 Tax=Cercophora newfieldiana TaxID=92897 RepID=A0AA39Y8K4_9PEZI|nr:hypothetical protein B0T16DRAFT_407622 [Cercophora newfieldiana]